MKNILLVGFLLLVVVSETKTQTATEILALYTEKTGGQEEWDAVYSIKAVGRVKLIGQNMEFPFLRIRMKDGRQYTSLNTYGMTYIATAFDGIEVWGSQADMELEKKDSSELERVIREAKEYPYTTHNWSQKGFKTEWMGKDTIEGVGVYKIKIQKDDLIIDGQPTDNISILYINAENYFLILTETMLVEGPNKGRIMQAYMSDYREIQGYWYPFYSELKYDGETAQIFLTEEVEINSSIDEDIFRMPITNK